MLEIKPYPTCDFTPLFTDYEWEDPTVKFLSPAAWSFINLLATILSAKLVVWMEDGPVSSLVVFIVLVISTFEFIWFALYADGGNNA